MVAHYQSALFNMSISGCIWCNNQNSCLFKDSMYVIQDYLLSVLFLYEIINPITLLRISSKITSTDVPTNSNVPKNQWSALIPPRYLPALPVLIHVAFATLQSGFSISFSLLDGKFPLHSYHIYNPLKYQVDFPSK